MIATAKDHSMPKFVVPTLLIMAALEIAPLWPAVATPQTLPEDVVPVHYTLSIVPDGKALTWQGNVVIAIEVKKQTEDVILNAEDLIFDHVTLDGTREATTSLDPGLGRATLHFAAPLTAGAHTLSIAYHGKIGRQTLGFFAMDYQTAKGTERTLATNFEPASARKFLPCWDEPARKATFTVSIDIPSDRAAISNMPVQTEEQLSPLVKRVHFVVTPRMSTYLLFLGIGDFERIHRIVDGVDVGVVVKRGDTAKAAYALDQALLLIHFYNDYFGYHFPLPKLDLVAAPGEIDGGSMENWGAIFYSQDELLFDPAKSTESDRQDVFLVVSHEMAHQWFGDLVTMAWWDNLWLNEGFARWMQTYAADALHPEWKTGLQAQSIFERGKQFDATPSTHPVVQDVDTAAQAMQAFDSITYDKGAAVITMLNAYVGRDAFRSGVRRYIRLHAFGNTVDADLWSIMEKVAKKPILHIEHDFTRQEGLPLVLVSMPTNGLHLAEERVYTTVYAGRRGASQQWTIPLTLAVQGAPPRQVLLADTITLPVHAPALVNAGQTAYARVLYPPPQFEALLPQVPTLPPIDQLGLLNDSAALGLASYAPLSNFFALVQKLPLDADPIVWRRAANFVLSLDHYYTDTPARAAFRNFARGLLKPVLARIGEKPRAGESPNMPSLRDMLASTLGHLGDQAVITRARELLAGGTGTPDEQRAALDIAAEAADAAEFDVLLDRARKSGDPLDKERIYESLSAVADPSLATRMIAIALTDEVPAGSNAGMISRLAYYHPDLVWSEAIPHIADPKSGLSRDEQWSVVQAAASNFSDLGRIPEVQGYIDANVPADAHHPFVGTVAAIKDNNRVDVVVLANFDQWIAAQNKPEGHDTRGL
jgi:aminopeptidase N